METTMKKIPKRRKKVSLYDVVLITIIVLLCCLFILPFWMIIASAFTDNTELSLGYSLWPKKWSLEGWTYMFKRNDINFPRAIMISVIISISGTVLSTFVSLITAYAISKKYLPGVKYIRRFLIITMYFCGGAIPLFLVIKKIGLYDTLGALIVPSIFSLYNIILLRNYFCSIPDSMEEAARIDGANDFQILTKIYLPMSLPMMGTIAFFVFVERWNSWFDALLYLGVSEKSESIYPLQYILYNFLQNSSSSSASLDVDVPTMTARSVGVVITIIPLLFIMPIVQRFFVNGITAGADKG